MKKNVRFFIKLICALLPLLLLIMYTALVPFGYMDSEYPGWKYTDNVISDANGLPDSVILGDSRAMADLIPSEEDLPAVNLAVGGATSIEMYYALDNYIKNNGVPENVIIMFAPFHYTVIDNFWTRTAYFNFLSASEVKDLISYAKAAGSETIIRNGYKNDFMSYFTRFPDKYLPALLNARFFGRYSANSQAYSKIAENYGYSEFGTADGCSDLNYEASYEHMHLTGDAVLLDMYLDRLLKLCSDNNINTVLAVPPMNASSFNALKPSYVSELSDYFNNLKIKYPAITVDGEIPCYDDIYFGDSSHLNRKGAEKFTKEFSEKYMQHAE